MGKISVIFLTFVLIITYICSWRDSECFAVNTKDWEINATLLYTFSVEDEVTEKSAEEWLLESIFILAYDYLIEEERPEDEDSKLFKEWIAKREKIENKLRKLITHSEEGSVLSLKIENGWHDYKNICFGIANNKEEKGFIDILIIYKLLEQKMSVSDMMLRYGYNFKTKADEFLVKKYTYFITRESFKNKYTSQKDRDEWKKLHYFWSPYEGERTLLMFTSRDGVFIDDVSIFFLVKTNKLRNK